ncbi:uncharacterized protein LOC131936739 [Physella acuta]|uniref:uncharacterized protein LOC131936739 n=1 Tax=Physella acuta TaxID=109671 RepID=UPI0027DB0269|nr:uncharacterized protein LOC131936739 [Physella acuta]
MASNNISNNLTENILGNLDDQKSMTNDEDISKYFSGTHEVQECLEGQGEACLHTHMANCKKNPGHKHFIPVKQLGLEHFPSGYHDNDLYDFIKFVAHITVRIAVKYISPDRPEFTPGTKDPYPCYNTRGKRIMRTGTGRVLTVAEITQGLRDYRTCPCPECEHSDTPSKVWWRIQVVTASHVVFDESEARKSSCRLWFDDDKSPEVKIYVWKSGSIIVNDMSILNCATHDIDLYEKVRKTMVRYIDLWQKLEDKYKSRRDVDKLTIIVSHPHGCSKQVSVGHWVDRHESPRPEVNGHVGEGKISRYTYTTCTCPGSSGAFVYRVGCAWSSHAHTGCNPTGLNYSGSWEECDL